MLPVILADKFMSSVLADIQFPVECSPAAVKNTDVYKYVPNINTFINTPEYDKSAQKWVTCTTICINMHKTNESMPNHTQNMHKYVQNMHKYAWICAKYA